MLEVLGITALEDIGLLSVVAADVLLPELILAEALVLAGVLIVRAVRKHKQEKEEEQNKPSQDDQEEPIAPDNMDDDVIEENKQIDQEIDEEIKNLEPDEAIQEQRQELEQEMAREDRLDAMRRDIGVQQTPDEILLYPPGIREQMAEVERLERLAEERERRRQNQNPEPDGDPDEPPNGGGGGGGAGDEPDPNNGDEVVNPYNDNPNRNINPNQNPFMEILKESATRIAVQYANQLTKEKEEEKKHEEGKITDEDWEQLQAENQQIKNQLETQKQLLDILDAMGMNELTDEQSLVQLEKIDQDIRQMTQKQVKVGDVFSQDLVTF